MICSIDILEILHNERMRRGPVKFCQWVFCKRKFLQGKWVNLGPKMMHWIQIWTPSKDFFKDFKKIDFCTIKEAQKCIETKVMVFLEKKLFREIGSIWAQKIMCRHNCNCSCNGLTVRVF